MYFVFMTMNTKLDTDDKTFDEVITTMRPNGTVVR